MKFIGRKAELAALKGLVGKPKGQLAVIRGRRRIGKSRLAEEVGKEFRFLKFSGIAPSGNVTAQDQRQVFANQLSQYLQLPEMVFHDWDQVFTFLAKQITLEPTVILLDEISWMGSKDPTFLPKLKNAWDLYFQNYPYLLLILCGSVSTWIEENIIRSTAFFGRISKIITLEPFSLKESVEFLKVFGFKTSPYELLKLLSVLGGIPWYLEQLDPTLTADENIKQLCFLKDSLLLPEFERIFSDIFSKRGEIYKKIIEELVKNPCDQATLREHLDYSRSGSISQYLEDLILCGFVSKHQGWSIKTLKPKKHALYRVKDHFIRFYFRFMLPNKYKIEQDTLSNLPLSSLPAWDSVVGLQLENLVIANCHQLYQDLKIPLEDIIASGSFIQKPSSTRKGCQIDYLIQTRSNLIYAVEIKFSRHPLRTDVINEVKNKLQNFDQPKHVVVNPVLVHVDGVEHSLVERDYFYKIIDLKDWFTA